ncbi:MAG: four-carbon acid sugar kinase family protein [Acidobacteria bacterium]|nr:four-carbon acid sugar kinase family protein [Acidobacteriota bacterium]
MNNPLPANKPLFTYYGDDFTGSTDALEALASHGVDTVLFLAPPDDGYLLRFPHCRAVGIAGDSRSRPPEWMSRELPPLFRRLQEIGAPVVQYKICSTFDSSRAIGNIGRALEIGLEVFGGGWAPVVPAAPLLGRYVVFGNMFAASGGAVHRIDRHPVMAQHPVTPMDESDLRVHLARQTELPIELLDLRSLRRGTALRPDARAVLFDGVDEEDPVRTARLLWEARRPRQLFAVGSSGFTYGMLQFWRRQGWIPEPPPCAAPPPADRLLVLSGSCSAVTARQIRTALDRGFQGVRLDPAQTAWPAAARTAAAELAAGRSVILYTALEPDHRMEVIDRQELAAAMGRLLRDVIRASGATRVVVAGGDTASHAVQELELKALTYSAPITRGAPLCRAHGWNGQLELVLKGGQVGADDFLERAQSCQ